MIWIQDLDYLIQDAERVLCGADRSQWGVSASKMELSFFSSLRPQPSRIHSITGFLLIFTPIQSSPIVRNPPPSDLRRLPIHHQYFL